MPNKISKIKKLSKEEKANWKMLHASSLFCSISYKKERKKSHHCYVMQNSVSAKHCKVFRMSHHALVSGGWELNWQQTLSVCLSWWFTKVSRELNLANYFLANSFFFHQRPVIVTFCTLKRAVRLALGTFYCCDRTLCDGFPSLRCYYIQVTSITMAYELLQCSII